MRFESVEVVCRNAALPLLFDPPALLKLDEDEASAGVSLVGSGPPLKCAWLGSTMLLSASRDRFVDVEGI